MTFFEKNEDIINNLSSKHRLNKDLVEEMIGHTFLSIRECMGMEEMPNILLHNWGRFFPRLRYIEEKLLTYQLHLKKGGILNESKYNRLKAFFNAYVRLCEEEKRTQVNLEYIIEQLKLYEEREKE